MSKMKDKFIVLQPTNSIEQNLDSTIIIISKFYLKNKNETAMYVLNDPLRIHKSNL